MINFESGSAIFIFIRSRILFGILNGPVALLEFMSPIISNTSTGWVGIKKKLCSFSSVKKCVNSDPLGYILDWSLSAMVEKYVLKLSATSNGSEISLLLTINDEGLLLPLLLIFMI